MAREDTDTIAGLQKALEDARLTLEEQNAVLERLNTPPFGMTRITYFDTKTRTAVTANGTVYPKVDKSLELSAGDWITVVPMTGAILAKLELPPKLGPVCHVLEVNVDDHTLEVEGERGKFTVINGGHFGKDGPQKGDQVILDESAKFVMFNKGKPKEVVKVEHLETGVAFKDIGGLAHAKSELLNTILGSTIYGPLYTAYGRKPPRGVLLHGPPGCGKTMLGKAVATELGKAHGSETAGFVYIKATEILSQFVAVAEQRIAQLFHHAREFHSLHKYPAVIFIDEADAIMNKRGSGRSSDIERTIVPAFLAEMDGLDTVGAIVILATNRPDTLDPAIIRDGRIDRKIHVPRPDVAAAGQILGYNLKGVPVIDKEEPKSLVKAAIELLYSDKFHFYEVEMTSGKRDNVYLRSMVSGAMLTNIVTRAIDIAMKRDLDNERKKPTGVSTEDMTASVWTTYEEQIHTDHSHVFEELSILHNSEVRGVRHVAKELQLSGQK